MLIQSILSCRYIEASATYFLQRCCLDLFLNFAQQDAISDETRPPSEEQTALFNQIFAYLTEHPHINQTVQEIAKMFDIRGVKLAQEFRAQFSIGITAFLHMLKMNMIYHTLMQKACTLRDLALVAGYTHIEDMVRDLEKHYGCNLAALRRSM
jgi:AraC-like DNA-binding protein